METIGIKLADGSFYPVLDDKPCKKALELTTVKDNQTRVMVDLYRTKTGTMDDADYVDTLQIDNLVAHPNGEASISLTVSLDEENRLSAYMVDPETGAHSDSNVTLVSRTPEERMEPADFELARKEDAAGGAAESGSAADAGADSDFSDLDETLAAVDFSDGDARTEETAAPPDEDAAPETDSDTDGGDTRDGTAAAFAAGAAAGGLLAAASLKQQEAEAESGADLPGGAAESGSAADAGADDDFSDLDETLAAVDFSGGDAQTAETDFAAPAGDVTLTEEDGDGMSADGQDGTDFSGLDLDLPDFDAPDDTAAAPGGAAPEENTESAWASADDPTAAGASAEDGGSENQETADDFSDITAADGGGFGDETLAADFSDATLAASDFSDGTRQSGGDDDAFDAEHDEKDLSDLDLDLPDFDQLEQTGQTDDSSAADGEDAALFNPMTAARSGSPAGGNTPSGGIDFSDLYDKETEEGISSMDEDDRIERKTKKPVIICIICAVICVIATLLVLFIVPSKYNLIKSRRTAPVAEESAPVEDAEPEPPAEELPPPPPPAPEAKEDEIVVVEEPEQVVPEPPAPPAEKPKDITYKIKWGDTLWDIADAYYDNPWRYHMIARYNNIRDPDYIISGTTIVLPAR